MKLHFSTLLIQINDLWATSIDYTSITDGHRHKHFLPKDSRFPFDKLQKDGVYVLVSIKQTNQWYWLYSIQIKDSNEVLEDVDLVEYIEKAGEEK